MERLTEKTISVFKYDLKDFQHKAKEFNDYDAFYQYNLAVGKLGEVEDFMEKWEFDHIEEMDKFLTDCEKAYLTQEKELQAYKQMWKELKKWLKKESDEVSGIPYDCKSLSNDFELWMLNNILDKIAELEKSVEVDNGNND